LSRQLNGRVRFGGSLRNWFAWDGGKQTKNFLLEVKATFTLGESGDSEENFAPDYRAGDHTILRI